MATYYVAPNGSNTTGNGSEALPWLTIGYAVGRSHIGAGDRILAKGTGNPAKGTYREIVYGKTAVVGNPLIIAAYPGHEITISACDLVGGWTLHDAGLNIWKSSAMAQTRNGASGTENQPAGNDLIFHNGIALPEARYPHLPAGKKISELLYTDWRTADTGTGGNQPSANGTTVSGTLNDTGLSALNGINLVGARITFVAGSRWVCASGTITATTSNSVTFDFANYQGSNYALTLGGIYFLWGHYNLLGENEWFRDATTSTLYLRLPAGQSPGTVEAKKTEIILDFYNRGYIKLQDLKIVGGRCNTSSTSHGIIFDNCTFKNCTHRLYYANWFQEFVLPVLYLQGNSCEITNCTIEDSAGGGISALGNGYKIQNNVIKNVGFCGADVMPLLIQGGNHLPIENNELNGNGSPNAVKFKNNTSGDFIFQNNICKATGKLATDGGAGMITKDNNPANPVVIQNNIISKTYGVFDYSKTWYGVSGFYTEGNISNFIFRRNIIFGIIISIKIIPLAGHSNLNIKIYNNTCTGYLNFIPTGQDYTGTEIINNTFTTLYLTNPRNDLILRNNAFSGASYTNNLLIANFGLDSNYAPLSSSALINAGEVIAGTTDGYFGLAPDIGAKEYIVLPPFVPNSIKAIILGATSNAVNFLAF